MTFGKYIARARAKKGLTQKQLAEAIGGDCRQGAISKYERDEERPRPARLVLMCKVLEIEPEDLPEEPEEPDINMSTILEKDKEILELQRALFEAEKKIYNSQKSSQHNSEKLIFLQSKIDQVRRTRDSLAADTSIDDKSRFHRLVAHIDFVLDMKDIPPKQLDE